MSRFDRRMLLGLPFALGFASAAAQERDVWPGSEWAMTQPQRLNADASLPDQLAAAVAAAPSVTGVVVVRHGQIVAEVVTPGWAADRTLDIRSCTKSVVAALVGTARQSGLLPDLDVTIGDLLSDRIPDDADPRVADIPLWSLLTMTSGIAWDWSTDYERLEAETDPVAYTLSQPVTNAPGEVYAYNSGGSHQIGLMVAAATGMPLRDYAGEALFAPLGMRPSGWRTTAAGEEIGGYGLRLTPRDMARLGLLYLRGGVWRDTRLITDAYVEQSTIRQSDGDPTGGTPYGYQWWVTGATGYEAAYALGYGGQYIYIVPALALIVVTAVGDIDRDLFAPRPIIERVVIPLVYPD